MPIVDLSGTDILPETAAYPTDGTEVHGKTLDDDQTSYESSDNPQSGNPQSGKPVVKNPHITEKILIDSRISPMGSGNLADKPNCTAPTSGQKWWAAIILGVLFALLSSPPAYAITSAVSTSLGGMPLYTFTDTYPGQTLLALFIHTLIFILIVRILLW